MSTLYLWELENPSLGNLLEEKTRRDRDSVVVLHEEQRITYGQLNEHANRAANGLLKLGVRKGDTVCLWLPNSPEWLYLWFGMAKIGAILVPVLPGLNSAYLAHQINQSDAETVILHASFLDAFDDIAERLIHMKRVIVDTREASSGMAELPPGSIPLDRVFDSSAKSPAVDVGYPDIAHIVYTSGTTGFPKGLVMRHPAPVPKPATPPPPPADSPYAMKPGDTIYMFYPLPTWFAMFAGGFAVDLAVAFPREKRYDRFWHDARRYNATMFMYFADLIPALLREPEKENDGDNPVRFCMGIMAPKDPESVPAFEKRFNVKVIETYASSEGGGVSINEAGTVGSVGKPLPNLEVKIVDDNGNERGPNEVGEIVHRRKSGDPITVEYYKMPEQSAAKTRDGWFHSDDLGCKDEDGNLYFVDRKLDVIKSGGRYIFASTVEAALSEHPGISECVAVGVPCGPEDDEIKLCVVRKKGVALSPEEAFRFCVEKLENYMVPRYIEFKNEFPRSSRGKVQRIKLRAEGITPETWDRNKSRFKSSRV